MLSEKKIRQFEHDNARSAAAILKDPQKYGAGLEGWAEAFQRHQRAEKAAREAEATGQTRFSFRGGRS